MIYQRTWLLESQFQNANAVDTQYFSLLKKEKHFTKYFFAEFGSRMKVKTVLDYTLILAIGRH